MATKLFIRGTNIPSTYSTGTNTAKADTTTSGWIAVGLSVSAGAGAQSMGVATPTVTGATNGVEIQNSALPCEWFSEPLAADITVSGLVTFNVWMSENNMSANVGAQCIVERVGPTGTISTVSNSESGVEVPVTTATAQNWTATPTSTAFKRGDRIRIRVLGNDVGTMASTFTFDLRVNGPTGAADGDSWVQFTEALTFESDPAGSQVFLTDTASDVATADVDREGWTARGSGSVTDVTNTAIGWTAPIQVTDTAGGTAVTWWTKQLNAFTLGGKALVNVRALESNNLANAVVRCEIAIANSDGSSPVVWGSATGVVEIAAADGATLCYPSGPDTAVTNGQRLRIRLFIDDHPSAAMGGSQTVTTTYSGTSAAAAGDTYVTLQQTVTELVASETNSASAVLPQVWNRGFGAGSPSVLYSPCH